jgi:hypothetical protein
MASRFAIPVADVGPGISPSDGAKLFFFDKGTSTPRNTYSDSAATTPNANPVIADGNGVFPDIYIVGTYKVVLKDKNNVQIEEWDTVYEVTNKQTLIDSYTRVYENIAAVIADTDLTIGQTVQTNGYTTANDGGGAEYIIVAGGTGTDDGGSYHDLDNGNQAELIVGEFINIKLFGAIGDGVADDAPSVLSADTFAAANGKPVWFPMGDFDISQGGTDYIEYAANWLGECNENSKVVFKNIQWINQTSVSIKNLRLETDAPQSGGSIDGYGGTNGFTTKIGNSGNIDICATTHVYFIDNYIENTVGTTNLFKTEACANVIVRNNDFIAGGVSQYGNKENRVDIAFGIPTTNSRSNVVYTSIDSNRIDGGLINDFDSINIWGGVGGQIVNNDIRNSRYDGMDVFTSGESMIISGNTLFEIGHIGIQLKIDTNANDRDSLGAGLNRRVVISDNVIENVYPKDSSTGSGVGDINGIMMLFSDDQGELPSPDNDEFVHHIACHDNIIIGVHDDDEYADADARISGISCDVYMSTVHNNIISGVRRQPSSTVSNTGNALVVNSVGVGAVSYVDLNDNLLSAQINGIYVNGSVTKTGRVNHISMNGNKIFQDNATSSQTLTNAGIFISPGCDDITIDGGYIDSSGPGVMLRRDFNNVRIQNLTEISSGNHSIRLEGYGTGLKIINNNLTPTTDGINIVTTVSNWDTLSEDWVIDNNQCSGNIDLVFDNAAIGGLDKLKLSNNTFTNDSQFMLKGFDNAGGNKLTNFRANGNTFDSVTTPPSMDLARLAQFRITDNHMDAGANSVNLVLLASSCSDAVISENDGFTSGLLINVGSATNINVRNNQII